MQANKVTLSILGRVLALDINHWRDRLLDCCGCCALDDFV